MPFALLASDSEADNLDDGHRHAASRRSSGKFCNGTRLPAHGCYWRGSIWHRGVLFLSLEWRNLKLTFCVKCSCP